MANKISVPRGTTDILPDEVNQWQDIEFKARQILSTYNYKEIRTPIFESTGLFQRSLGQTSDVVNKQLLELVSSKEEGFSLRPEGTASIVRSYIENNISRKESITKYFYIGPMFRGERPQKGRLRQFHQIGVEVIGPNASHPNIDAEVIGLNATLLNTFGIGQFEVKINTLGTPKDKESFSKQLRELLRPQLSKLCEDCQNRFERNVFRILDCKNKACSSVVSKLKLGHAHLSGESADYFEHVKVALDDLGVKYAVCPDLVRGLDYYTHTVFEITSASLGSQDALSAGGRYDNLVSQLGGPEVPAVGFALGLERVLLALGGKNTEISEGLNAYIIAMDEQSFQPAFLALNALRSEGVSGDMSYRIASMKSQMRLADKSGAKYVIIIGETELSKGVVALKAMATGEQEEISVKGGDYSGLCRRIAERQQ